jgi:MFS family permease
MFDLLADRWFRRLWVTTWLCYFGRWVDVTVLPWFVLAKTGSPSQVALVGVSRAAPMFLLGLVAGDLVDRSPKRRVVVAAQIANVVAASLLLTAIVLGQAQPWHVMAYMVLSGICGAVDFSGRRAYQSDLLPVNRLARAMALNSVALSGSSLLGPLLGGSLVSVVGYGGTYVVVAAAYLSGVVILLSLPESPQRASDPGASHPGVSLSETALLVLANQTVLLVLTVTVAMNLFGFSYRQALPLVARDKLGVGSVLYGVLSAAPGLGATVGAVLLSRRRVHRPHRLFFVGSVTTLVGILCFSLSPLYFLSLILLFAAGLGTSGFSAMQASLVLTETSAELRGRALGILAVAIGAFPVGSWLVGQMAEVMSADRVVVLMTGLGLLTVGTLWVMLGKGESGDIGAQS